MPTTFAPVAAEPEPTLREILNAVNGLGTRIDGLESRFDRFEVRVDGLESRFDGLESRFDRFEVRLDGLESRFDRFEVRVDGLESRFDRLEDRMVVVENGIKDLTTFAREQFAHTTTEIARLRAADEEHVARFERIDAMLDQQRLVNEEHRARFDGIDERLDELIRLGKDNQRIGLKNQQDIARIDRKLDAHIADHEVHLPRPRSVDVSDVGPMAA
jgi:chromosome segregation ATPase